MKPRLQTSLGQQLVLTPQLRQAIHLLQLSALELDAELERGRAMAAGHDPDKEPFLQLRDSRKLKKGSDKGLSAG